MTTSTNIYGFSKRYRLNSASDYKQAFSKPKKISTPELLFLYSENNQTYPRLGLAIAKKQLSHAVDRNKVKRLIRESFRQKKTILNSIDIVVMARKKLLNMDNTQIRIQLDKLWDQIANKRKL